MELGFTLTSLLENKLHMPEKQSRTDSNKLFYLTLQSGCSKIAEPTLRAGFSCSPNVKKCLGTSFSFCFARLQDVMFSLICETVSSTDLVTKIRGASQQKHRTEQNRIDFTWKGLQLSLVPTWPIQGWPRVKAYFKGTVQTLLKHCQPWGTDHHSRKSVPAFDHPLGKVMDPNVQSKLSFVSSETFPHVLSLVSREKRSAPPSLLFLLRKLLRAMMLLSSLLSKETSPSPQLLLSGHAFQPFSPHLLTFSGHNRGPSHPC